jgi:hypothetical protein
MRKCLIALVFVLFCLCVAEAAEHKVLLNEKTTHSPANFEIAFDSAEIAKGKQVRLGLDARIDGPLPGGSNPWMTVSINGTPLVAETLINKPVEFTMRNGMDCTWVTGQDWRIIIAPDFSSEIRTGPYPYGIPDVDPFHFEWDITRFIKKGTNTVSFVHKHLTAEGATLVLRNIFVETGEPVKSAATPTVSPAPTGAVPTYIVNDGIRPVDIDAKLSSSGAIRLRIGKRELEIKTRTSEPGGKWIETQTAAWSDLSTGKSAQARWAASGYEVLRKVAVEADHIKVCDTFTNISDKVVGIIYENRLSLPEKPIEILLAGRPTYAAEQVSREPYHPSAMARWNDLTVGLIAEDDIFRVHIKEFSEKGCIGIADPQLGIAPGKSHTLEWSIYPAPNGDYWDFINAVRRNWGSNFTIPSPLLVNFEADGSKTADYYAKWTRARGVKWQISNQATFNGKDGPKGHLAEGPDIMRATAWCNGIRQWAGKLRSRISGAKILVYLHPEISDDPNALTTFSDSKHIGADGKQITSPYSYPVYMYLSTLDNSHGKAMQKTVEYIVNNIHADGIFMDEMEPIDAGGWAYDTAWDQCTLEIDPVSHEIKRQYSSALLLELPWKLWMIKYMQEHGKICVGNFPTCTRTLHDTHILRFKEMGSYSFMIDMHLTSPWGLGMPAKTDRAAMTRRYLDYAGIFTPYGWTDEPNKAEFQFIPLMYPITPVELRPGMVLGKERILTNRSGRYGWPDGSEADVYVCDVNGKRVWSPSVKEVHENGRALTEIRMPGDNFAIIIRQKAAGF